MQRAGGKDRSAGNSADPYSAIDFNAPVPPAGRFGFGASSPYDDEFDIDMSPGPHMETPANHRLRMPIGRAGGKAKSDLLEFSNSNMSDDSPPSPAAKESTPSMRRRGGVTNISTTVGASEGGAAINRAREGRARSRAQESPRGKSGYDSPAGGGMSTGTRTDLAQMQEVYRSALHSTETMGSKGASSSAAGKSPSKGAASGRSAGKSSPARGGAAGDDDDDDSLDASSLTPSGVKAGSSLFSAALAEYNNTLREAGTLGATATTPSPTSPAEPQAPAPSPPPPTPPVLSPAAPPTPPTTTVPKVPGLGAKAFAASASPGMKAATLSLGAAAALAAKEAKQQQQQPQGPTLGLAAASQAAHSKPSWLGGPGAGGAVGAVGIGGGAATATGTASTPAPKKATAAAKGTGGASSDSDSDYGDDAFEPTLGHEDTSIFAKQAAIFDVAPKPKAAEPSPSLSPPPALASTLSPPVAAAAAKPGVSLPSGLATLQQTSPVPSPATPAPSAPIAPADSVRSQTPPPQAGRTDSPASTPNFPATPDTARTASSHPQPAATTLSPQPVSPAPSTSPPPRSPSAAPSPAPSSGPSPAVPSPAPPSQSPSPPPPTPPTPATPLVAGAASVPAAVGTPGPRSAPTTPAITQEENPTIHPSELAAELQRHKDQQQQQSQLRVPSPTPLTQATATSVTMPPSPATVPSPATSPAPAAAAAAAPSKVGSAASPKPPLPSQPASIHPQQLQQAQQTSSQAPEPTQQSQRPMQQTSQQQQQPQPTLVQQQQQQQQLQLPQQPQPPRLPVQQQSQQQQQHQQLQQPQPQRPLPSGSALPSSSPSSRSASPSLAAPSALPTPSAKAQASLPATQNQNEQSSGQHRATSAVTIPSQNQVGPPLPPPTSTASPYPAAIRTPSPTTTTSTLPGPPALQAAVKGSTTPSSPLPPEGKAIGGVGVATATISAAGAAAGAGVGASTLTTLRPEAVVSDAQSSADRPLPTTENPLIGHLVQDRKTDLQLQYQLEQVKLETEQVRLQQLRLQQQLEEQHRQNYLEAERLAQQRLEMERQQRLDDGRMEQMLQRPPRDENQEDDIALKGLVGHPMGIGAAGLAFGGSAYPSALGPGGTTQRGGSSCSSSSRFLKVEVKRKQDLAIIASSLSKDLVLTKDLRVGGMLVPQGLRLLKRGPLKDALIPRIALEHLQPWVTLQFERTQTIKSHEVTGLPTPCSSIAASAASPPVNLKMPDVHAAASFNLAAKDLHLLHHHIQQHDGYNQPRFQTHPWICPMCYNPYPAQVPEDMTAMHLLERLLPGYRKHLLPLPSDLWLMAGFRNLVQADGAGAEPAPVDQEGHPLHLVAPQVSARRRCDLCREAFAMMGMEPSVWGCTECAFFVCRNCHRWAQTENGGQFVLRPLLSASEQERREAAKRNTESLNHLARLAHRSLDFSPILHPGRIRMPVEPGSSLLEAMTRLLQRDAFGRLVRLGCPNRCYARAVLLYNEVTTSRTLDPRLCDQRLNEAKSDLLQAIGLQEEDEHPGRGGGGGGGGGKSHGINGQVSSDPRLWYLLGLIFCEMSDFNVGRKIYQKVLQQMPPGHMAHVIHFNLACIHAMDPESRKVGSAVRKKALHELKEFRRCVKSLFWCLEGDVVAHCQLCSAPKLTAFT